jgi:hypothetical protein
MEETLPVDEAFRAGLAAIDRARTEVERAEADERAPAVYVIVEERKRHDCVTIAAFTTEAMANACFYTVPADADVRRTIQRVALNTVTKLSNWDDD